MTGPMKWLKRQVARNHIIKRNPLITFDRLLTTLLTFGVILVICRVFNLLFPDIIKGLISNNRILKDVFGTAEDKNILGILTFLFTAYMSKEILLQKKTADMEISNAIYSENTKKRGNKKIKKIADSITEIMSSCNSKEDAQRIATAYEEDPSYDKLKEFIYHYEYLGYLVYYEKIDFHLLYDTISFPDQILDAAQKSVNGFSFIDSIRNSRRDYWIGVEYLYSCYRLMRAQDEKNFKVANKKYDLAHEKEEWKRCWDMIPK